jgi:hypothetical protein
MVVSYFQKMALPLPSPIMQSAIQNKTKMAATKNSTSCEDIKELIF